MVVSEDGSMEFLPFLNDTCARTALIMIAACKMCGLEPAEIWFRIEMDTTGAGVGMSKKIFIQRGDMKIAAQDLDIPTKAMLVGALRDAAEIFNHIDVERAG